MKVIFIDIDGVLRHDRCDNLDEPFKFDSVSVSILNSIVEKTGAKAVISSSWRLYFELDVLNYLFKYNGFIGEVIDSTPVFLKTYTHEICRGEEISKWIEKNPVEGFCIIDDCNDILPEQQSCFVFVDDKTGLTEEDAAKAVEILSK